MTIFFTADHHFGHSNIIKYEKRPFANSFEMDEELIKRWNEVVKSKDQVYHLGDVSLRNSKSTAEILNRLNGKIFLIKGNHEKSVSKPECQARFEWVKDYHFIKLPDKNMIAMMHYCMRIWDRKFHGAWHLFGHSHSYLKEVEGELAINVGVDCWNYYPVSYEQIKAKMQEKKLRIQGSLG